LGALRFRHLVDQEALEITDTEFLRDLERDGIVDPVHHHNEAAVEGTSDTVAV
jgi:hypothetical protein